MVLAGLDDSKNQIDPGELTGEVTGIDLFEALEKELPGISNVPASLKKTLEALQKDNDFLKQGDVFTDDFIENGIAYKYEEVQQLCQRPHPYQFPHVLGRLN